MTTERMATPTDDIDILDRASELIEADNIASAFELLGNEIERLRRRDALFEKMKEALRAMVDRWEPDCDGQDRSMWEDAVAALPKEQAG